jgi:hypothetical protein
MTAMPEGDITMLATTPRQATMEQLKGMTSTELLLRANELAAQIEAEQQRMLGALRELGREASEMLMEMRGDIRTAERVRISESIEIEKEYDGTRLIWIGEDWMEISQGTYARLRATVVR